MQRPLLDFVCSGAVGELSLGLSRHDVIAKLGEPENWLGKPPCVGPIVTVPGDASVWFYYGDAVGVEFDQQHKAVRIGVTPEKVRSLVPFDDWLIRSGVKMLDFRHFLVQNRIPFYEEMNPEDTHFILANKGCVAQCSYYENGRMLHPDDRPLTMIATVEDDELLPNFVRGKRQREWSMLRAFFGAHFHENWRREGGSPDKVVSVYVRKARPENLGALRNAILGYLRRFENDDDLERKLSSELGCRYDPSSEGRSVRNWLGSIISRLE